MSTRSSARFIGRSHGPVPGQAATRISGRLEGEPSIFSGMESRGAQAARLGGRKMRSGRVEVGTVMAGGSNSGRSGI